MPQSPFQSASTGARSASPASPSDPEAVAKACERGRVWVGFDPELDLACARFKLTDMGNAERWRVRHGANFRFCAEIGWFAWDGRRWKLLSEEKDALPAEVMQSVFATVRAIGNEAVIVAATGCRVLIGLTERKMDTWLD